MVPAKNEAAGLPGLLAELNGVLEGCAGLQTEVLVIDDGSTDDTAEIAEAAGARVIRHPESLGNGAAVKRGIREAQLDWVLLLDGDGQHPPAAIPELIEPWPSRTTTWSSDRAAVAGGASCTATSPTGSTTAWRAT